VVTSNTIDMEAGIWMISLFGRHNFLLSSSTVLRFSIHSASTGPSITSHRRPGDVSLAICRKTTAKTPSCGANLKFDYFFEVHGVPKVRDTSITHVADHSISSKTATGSAWQSQKEDVVMQTLVATKPALATVNVTRGRLTLQFALLLGRTQVVTLTSSF
jgi:hypothetical protein